MVDLSGGDHLEYGRERWLRQANCAFFFGLDNEQVRSVKRTCGLDIDAVPTLVRVGHGDGTPAHQNPDQHIGEQKTNMIARPTFFLFLSRTASAVRKAKAAAQ